MDSRIKKSLDFIDENFNRNLGSKEVSRHCSLSISRFSKVFKEEVGMTFKSCLKAKRIKKAKEFLKDDTLIIKQLSYAIGYKSIPTFCHYSKEITGLTPSEHQKSYKKRVSRKIGNFNKKIVNFNKTILLTKK